MTGSTISAGSGISASIRSRPSSRGASVNAPRAAATTDRPERRTDPMIDIVREIEAVQREVGEGPSPPARAATIRLQRDYDAPIEDVWDALTEPGAHRPLVPAHQRRLPPRRSLPVRGQRRRRDRRLRATEPVEGHVGLRRGGKRRRRLGGRGPAVDGRWGRDTLRARAHGDRARGDRGLSTARAPSASAGTGAAGADAPPARRVGRRSDRLAGVGRGPRFRQASSEAWGEANLAAGADPDVVARAVANTTRSTRRIPIRRRRPDQRIGAATRHAGRTGPKAWERKAVRNDAQGTDTSAPGRARCKRAAIVGRVPGGADAMTVAPPFA